ncbi:DUF6266 family protein [Pedobacter gandavensis]|uniref:Uncharacterized protein n=1 Tax=Pedobacter gandavensis TaxID=2679963 RepID=A0ABR6EV03_9SPHI|nr:DUF6266 family protein [Pedobacter gandavensis]MBB2149091.1 hypothetical protein [Pedobacter gandavensis]
MAIASNGPQGHLNGKVGNLVFYMLNGQPVVRLIGRKGKPSILQLANYQGMAVTTKLLSRMGGFIKLGYGLQARGTVHNAHNLATSYHKKQALKGEYPNISIDYSKVKLSQGLMSETKDLKINKVSGGLEISWDPRDYADLSYNDSVMVMICCPETGKDREYLNIARRSEGKCFIPLFEEVLNQQIEPYISFISADGAMVSDSVYLGNLNGEGLNEIEKQQQVKYQQVKSRFDQLEGSYSRQLKENYGEIPKTKAFKCLEKEYKAVQKQLLHLPGKPG